MHATRKRLPTCALRWLATSAAAATLLLSLTGCGETRRAIVRGEPVTKIVEKYRSLPVGLTDPVAGPKVPGEPLTWADVNELGLGWRKAALACDLKLAKIRGLEGGAVE